MVDEFIRRATVERVVDGDTLDVLIDLGWDITLRERVRLLDVNAPETKGESRDLGLLVKSHVEGWCSQFESVWIRSREYRRGKYGRTLAVVLSPDGTESLNVLVSGWSRLHK